jgi:hypothetical protein
LLTRGAQDSSVVARVEPIRDAKVSFIREQQEPSANSTCISNVLGEYITGLRKNSVLQAASEFRSQALIAGETQDGRRQPEL